MEYEDLIFPRFAFICLATITVIRSQSACTSSARHSRLDKSVGSKILCSWSRLHVKEIETHTQRRGKGGMEMFDAFRSGPLVSRIRCFAIFHSPPNGLRMLIDDVVEGSRWQRARWMEFLAFIVEAGFNAVCCTSR